MEIRQEFTPYTSNHVRAYGRNSGTRLPFSFLAKDENKLKIKARHGVRKSQEIFHWNDRNCLTLNPFLCERVNHQGNRICEPYHPYNFISIRFENFEGWSLSVTEQFNLELGLRKTQSLSQVQPTQVVIRMTQFVSQSSKVSQAIAL